jgi:hypothetical protein
MLICLNFDLFKPLDALLCLDVDVHSHHFVSENHSKVVSLDPRCIRPRLSWAHTYLLDNLRLHIEFYLRRVDLGKAKGQSQPYIFVLIVFHFGENWAESIGEWERSQVQRLFRWKISKQQLEALVLAQYLLGIFFAIGEELTYSYIVVNLSISINLILKEVAWILIRLWLLKILQLLINRLQILWFEEKFQGLRVLPEIEWENSLVKVEIWLVEYVAALNIEALCW